MEELLKTIPYMDEEELMQDQRNGTSLGAAET